MTGESVIDDGIRWDRLGRERFDELVEALLSRVHDGDGHVVEFPEGKGGDAGRDAVATVDGRTVVYQFKYYTDGLSTSGSNRASAVKKSFKRALEHSPDEWILVVPCKLTRPVSSPGPGPGQGQRSQGLLLGPPEVALAPRR